MHRVITGHTDDGKSVFINDEEPPRVVTLDNLPGFELTEVWMTEGIPAIPTGKDDPTLGMSSFAPEVGGTRFRIVRFPSLLNLPQPSGAETDLDAARQEYRTKVPGLGDSHEPENPGMHTTDTVDYGIVLSGKICLELDDGAEVCLKQGDCVVQNGTRHAWRNRGKEPCMMAFVMLGGTRNV